LRAYLFGIGRKRAAEFWRRQKARGETSERTELTASSADTNLTVSEAFAHLPDDQRTLLWLREVERQSYAELAEIFEIPVGTVRSRLFASREALRRIWHGAQNPSKEGP
jgi:RNA polymerase sigma-70 factor (ECF subfamily)